ncbi:hypothetical protein D1872_37770 [compost metagenome]|jgi:hypothetical protein
MAGLGKEVFFSVDDFKNPKMVDEMTTLSQMILNLFLMRPGNMPSMPHIGIDIRQYLYKLEEDIDAEELQQKIYDQCTALFSRISLGEIRIFLADLNNVSTLIIVVPIAGTETSILYGFAQSPDDATALNYAVQFQTEAQK